MCLIIGHGCNVPNNRAGVHFSQMIITGRGTPYLNKEQECNYTCKIGRVVQDNQIMRRVDPKIKQDAVI